MITDYNIIFCQWWFPFGGTAPANGKVTQKINIKSEKEEETYWNMESKKEEETESKNCKEDIAVTNEPWHWKLTPRNQNKKMEIKS